MNIDIKKISELNEANYNDNLLFLVEDQDGKGKKLKGVSFKEVLKSDLINQIYPIGAIYISLSPTSPMELFGGNWIRIKDVFLLTAGDNYSVSTGSKDGGESTVTLTVNQIPSHYGHLYENWIGGGNATSRYLSSDKMSSFGELARGWNLLSGEFYPAGLSIGGGQSHNNMPPYKVINAWQRIPDVVE